MPQDLSPCPFCGESKGYTLSDGSTFRWWVVSCAGCGGDVGECRSDSSTRLDAPKPERWPAADDEWNEAAAHAQSLRTALEAQAAEIARLREVIAAVNSRCDHLGMRLGEVIKERDGLRVDAERWQGLYRRAVNVANGLTNYVDERPELRRAERELIAIQTEARAAREST